MARFGCSGKRRTRLTLRPVRAATLLPFDQIVTIAAQLLPLKYQFQEQYLAYRNQDANRMTVNRITLSYSRVQNRDNLENFSMLPVWDFFDADDRRSRC